MENGYTLKDIKKYLKETSVKIHILKILRKNEFNQKRFLLGLDLKVISEMKEKLKKAPYISVILYNYQYEFRHTHIAYCLFKGKIIEQIEPKTNKKRNEKYIKEIFNKITYAMEELKNEDVRLSA